MIDGLDSNIVATFAVAAAGGYALLAFREPEVFRSIGLIIPAAIVFILGVVFVEYIAVQNTITAVNGATSFDVPAPIRKAMQGQLPDGPTIRLLVIGVGYCALIWALFLLKEQTKKKLKTSSPNERPEKDASK
jgi:hypothetical protein